MKNVTGVDNIPSTALRVIAFKRKLMNYPAARGRGILNALKNPKGRGS